MYRLPDDSNADQVRVRIWRVSNPNFESGYDGFTPGVTQSISHNLQVDPGNMLVDVTANQINGDHKMFYGRVDIGASGPFGGYAENDRAGYYWYNLSQTGLSVSRMSEDDNAVLINTRIWKIPSVVFVPLVKR